jgi:hypothetical protein
MSKERYHLTNKEWADVAEREMPEENFYQDGELNEEQAMRNLESLFIHKFVSKVTYLWYKQERYKNG